MYCVVDSVKFRVPWCTIFTSFELTHMLVYLYKWFSGCHLPLVFFILLNQHNALKGNGVSPFNKQLVFTASD